MNVLFLDAPYTGKVELCPETITFLKKKNIRCVALYASVQFCNNLEKIQEQLDRLNIKHITSRADRTHVRGQLLGCDNYHDSLHLNAKELEEIDAYLYIGDGKFHPLALVYAQKDVLKDQVKEIICNDPMARKMSMMDFSAIRVILRKYRASLMKFLVAKKVGVIVTVKPGQEHLKASFRLEKKFPDTKFYFFVDDVVSFSQLENFPFIEVWINTTCPRVGFDDQEKFVRGVVNLNDAFMVREILGKENALNNV